MDFHLSSSRRILRALPFFAVKIGFHSDTIKAAVGAVEPNAWDGGGSSLDMLQVARMAIKIRKKNE